MMKSGKLIVLTVFCCGIAAGCIGKSPQVSYYHLSPMEASSLKTEAVETGVPLAVGVGAARFPEALDRSQIVTRTDSNRYVIDEFHRWGSPLHSEFTRTFAENLSQDLNTLRVVVFPWEKHFQPRFRVALYVHRFDGRLGEFALLETRWTITDGEGEQTLSVGKSIIQEPVSDASYETHVKALDQTLKKFSEEIAAEIQRLMQAPE